MFRVVVGGTVERPPGLEFGDGLFDFVADLVDVGVELFLPVDEVVEDRFPDWVDGVGSEVALVGEPSPGKFSVKDSGGAQCGGVVGRSLTGSETHASWPERLQANWTWGHRVSAPRSR